MRAVRRHLQYSETPNRSSLRRRASSAEEPSSRRRCCTTIPRSCCSDTVSSTPCTPNYHKQPPAQPPSPREDREEALPRLNTRWRLGLLFRCQRCQVEQACSEDGCLVCRLVDAAGQVERTKETTSAFVRRAPRDGDFKTITAVFRCHTTALVGKPRMRCWSPVERNCGCTRAASKGARRRSRGRRQGWKMYDARSAICRRPLLKRAQCLGKKEDGPPSKDDKSPQVRCLSFSHILDFRLASPPLRPALSLLVVVVDLQQQYSLISLLSRPHDTHTRSTLSLRTHAPSNSHRTEHALLAFAPSPRPRRRLC